MKCTNTSTKQEKSFRPVSYTITLETEEDREMMLALFNSNTRLEEHLNERVYNIPDKAVEKFVEDIFPFGLWNELDDYRG